MIVVTLNIAQMFALSSRIKLAGVTDGELANRKSIKTHHIYHLWGPCIQKPL